MLSQTPRQSDIRNFLFVLLSGVVVACAVVGAMAYIYSPSGRFWSHHVLLAPEVIEEGVYNDFDPATGQTKRFVFERLEFTYFDKEKRKWVSTTVDLEAYRRFWKLVESDWSILQPTEDITSIFNVPHPSRLMVWMRPDPATGPVRVFQEVDFAPGKDAYRVELRGQQDITGQWAFFQHASIFENVLDLFVTH